MSSERTYVMLKPDCIKRGLMGEVISRIERKGYKITNAKMMMLDEAILREHYAHLADKPFFPEIVSFMTSGLVFGMIVEGENAVMGMRAIMGATNFANMAVGTIRGDFAFCTNENIIHGSDSKESAEIEIKRFFNKLLFTCRKPPVLGSPIPQIKPLVFRHYFGFVRFALLLASLEAAQNREVWNARAKPVLPTN